MLPKATFLRANNFFELGSQSLVELLRLEVPPIQEARPTFQQLLYIEQYIRRPDLVLGSTARSIAIEDHYIDRDFMADHSAFFCRNLRMPPNACRRVHFFAATTATIEEELRVIAELLYEKGDGCTEYKVACRKFSDHHYLGFTIIRPLPACPVGRTVLRLLPPTKDATAHRHMSCTRPYAVNFAGAEFSIQGLAFQQQDLGVSRCATVALWSALDKVEEAEGINAPTPAAISHLAAQFHLPLGRASPSSGLTTEQMCMAVHASGVSPYLVRAETFEQTRRLIFSATFSEMPSVLIIQKHESSEWHAVTIAGMKLAGPECACQSSADPSASLMAVYIHDDRIGPYRRAEIRAVGERMHLTIKVQSHLPDGDTEDWIVGCSRSDPAEIRRIRAVL